MTMECIACRAGVTKGTIYLYYASKGELFGALQCQEAEGSEEENRKLKLLAETMLDVAM